MYDGSILVDYVVEKTEFVLVFSRQLKGMYNISAQAVVNFHF